MSLWEVFASGGWVMWPLLVFSIISWAVIFERTVVYVTLRPRLSRLAQSVLHSLKSGDQASAKQLCHTEKAHVADLFLGTLDTQRNREFTERATERNRQRLGQYLKKHLWVLGTIGSSAPFLGLLGTVVGILGAFDKISEEKSGGFFVVAGEISEALIATAAGLIVAIIALLAYNICVNTSNQTVANLRISLEEMIDYSYGKAA